MALRCRAACVLLLLASTGCDGGDGHGELGYTVHIFIEVDGAYRGHYCANGNQASVHGLVGVRYPGSSDGFELQWSGKDGELELLAEDDLEDDAPRQFFLRERFDESFGASPNVRRLEAEFEGHHVVIYVESLGQDSSCGAAQHQPSHDTPGSSDAGVDAGGGPLTHPLNVPWLLDLHGAARDDVWAVGFNGVVLHFDGRGWTQTVDDDRVDLLHVWVSERGGDVWLIERTGFAETETRRLLRGRPGAFREVEAGAQPGELLDRPWGTGPGDLWVTGYTEDEAGRYGVVHHFDGSTWSLRASDVGGHLDAVWGSAPDDIFVAGNDGSGLGGYIAHFVSGELASSEYPDPWIGGLWGTSPSDVWAAGGALLHYDGSGWTPADKPSGVHMLHAVWGSAPDDFWAVGSQGTSATGVSGVILHWDGSAWTEAEATPRAELWAVWGSAPDDVWAVGSGAIYHYDGSEWSTTPPEAITIARP